MQPSLEDGAQARRPPTADEREPARRSRRELRCIETIQGRLHGE